eukprot:6150019-Ditylum_brightwellii.AAC.1
MTVGSRFKTSVAVQRTRLRSSWENISPSRSLAIIFHTSRGDRFTKDPLGTSMKADFFARSQVFRIHG